MFKSVTYIASGHSPAHSRLDGATIESDTFSELGVVYVTSDTNARIGRKLD